MAWKGSADLPPAHLAHGLCWKPPETLAFSHCCRELPALPGQLRQMMGQMLKKRREGDLSPDSPSGYYLGWQMLLGSANIVLRNALTTDLLIRSISHVCLLYLGPFPLQEL